MPDIRSPAPRAGGHRAYINDQRSFDTAPSRSAQLAPDAATAAGCGDRPPPSRVRLIAWRPVAKGALRGFATAALSSIRLKLVDCPVYMSNGKTWVALPSKPVLDRHGKQKTGANGKPAYVAVLEWQSRELSDAFSKAVIAAIRQKYPDALDGGGT